MSEMTDEGAAGIIVSAYLHLPGMFLFLNKQTWDEGGDAEADDWDTGIA